MNTEPSSRRVSLLAEGGETELLEPLGMCVCAAKEGEAGGEGTRLKSLQVKFLPSTFSSLTSSSGGLRSSASGGCYVRVFKAYLVIYLSILSLVLFICLFIFCFVSFFRVFMSPQMKSTCI